VPEAVPTVPRLFLGEALKQLRAESGRTIDELAADLGKDRTRLIRVFEGKGTLAVDELGQLLDLLGAAQKQRRELLALGAEARKRPSRRPYTDLLPRGYERLADLESMATKIWSYEPGVIPGLVQIPEYIEAMMTDGDGIWWESSWEERRNRINFRLERQKLMMAADAPKSLHFIITDTALRTEVGGPDTMHRQLEHLLWVVDERPNTTIQVLAATTPHNPAPAGGLMLLQLGEALRPVGYLPAIYGPGTYFDEPIDTARLSRAFGRLEGLAASTDKSRKVIADLVTRS
jgi:transcriptional regulator with XRE-family HTH domain